MSNDRDERMVAAAEVTAKATCHLKNLGIAAVFLTVVTVAVTVYVMCQQMQKTLDATMLELRPYLSIEHESYSVIYDFHSYRDDGSIDPIKWEIKDLELKGAEYMGVRDFRYQLDRKIQLGNIGATPLVVLRYITSTLSEPEWKERYYCDPNAFVTALQSFPEWEKARENFPIIPEQSVPTVGRPTRTMAVQEFEGHLETGVLNLYPYTYVEYEDCFGQAHFTLLLERLSFTLEAEDNFLQKPTPLERDFEEYRWDIFQ